MSSTPAQRKRFGGSLRLKLDHWSYNSIPWTQWCTCENPPKWMRSVSTSRSSFSSKSVSNTFSSSRVSRHPRVNPTYRTNIIMNVVILHFASSAKHAQRKRALSNERKCLLDLATVFWPGYRQSQTGTCNEVCGQDEQILSWVFKIQEIHDLRSNERRDVTTDVFPWFKQLETNSICLWANNNGVIVLTKLSQLHT